MSDKIAVLIDGENIDPLFAEKIFSFAESLGTLTIREIYGSGIALNAWSEPILKYTIHTNFTLRPNRFKNSSDIALVIGAMEILAEARYASPENGRPSRCDKVIIVSSDSDFSPLAVHLRSAGIEVIGMGEPKNTNPMWPKACSQYVELTAESSVQTSAPGKRAAAQTTPSESKAEKNREQESKKEPPASGKSQKSGAKPEPDVKKEAPAPDKSRKAEPKPEPAGKKEAPADKAPKPEPKPETEDKQPVPEEIQPSDAKKAAPAEQKIAPSHRERMEIIRKAVTEQIAAHNGRVKSGELFKVLSAMPDYRFDQQRSKRNPQDYLMKQYNAWFAFETGEKGSFWISLRPADAAQPAPETAAGESPEAEDTARPEESAAVPEQPENRKPDTVGEIPQSETVPADGEESPAPLTLEEHLTAAGVPFKDAVRAANILPKCRNMRDVYNRMRGAFGKDAGKSYYEIVKVLLQTAVFSFPPRTPSPAKPEDPENLPLTKEEIESARETPAEGSASPAIVLESTEPEEDAESTADEAQTAEDSAPRLTDGPVRYLLEKGVTSDKAVRIVSIFTGSQNQRVAYNELRKEFGGKGGQYLRLMKEFYKGNAD